MAVRVRCWMHGHSWMPVRQVYTPLYERPPVLGRFLAFPVGLLAIPIWTPLHRLDWVQCREEVCTHCHSTRRMAEREFEPPWSVRLKGEAFEVPLPGDWIS